MRLRVASPLALTRPLSMRLRVALTLAVLPGPLMARRWRGGATQLAFSTPCHGRCCAWLVLRVLDHRRWATQLLLPGDLRCRLLTLATLNQRFSLRLDLRRSSDLQPRHHARLRVLFTADPGTRSDLDLLGWRTRFARVRSTLDLDLRSSLALRH